MMLRPQIGKTSIKSVHMEFRPIHEVPIYLKECAEVLNEEWKRSLAARYYYGTGTFFQLGREEEILNFTPNFPLWKLHSLEKSKDSFPVCLVLLETNDRNETIVVGHSMLSDIRGQQTKSCLVESVVVRKSHRSKGYGRIIMEKTLKYAASKGFKRMYLTTHDKQTFYKHLGFEYCSPIMAVTSNSLPADLIDKLMKNISLQNVTEQLGKSAGNLDNYDDTHYKQDIINKPDNSPHQQNTPDKGNNSETIGASIQDCEINNLWTHNEQLALDSVNSVGLSSSVQTLAKTQLPPPPPPPPSLPKHSVQSDSQVAKWDPTKVSWMKIDIS